MNYSAKICPYCKAQLELGEGAFELVRKGMSSVDSSPGLPVSLYSCPQCGYIELYNLKIVTRI